MRTRSIVGFGIAIVAILEVAPATAQQVSVYSNAQADGYETYFGLLGVSLRPRGEGLQPVFSSQVFTVRYAVGTGSVTAQGLHVGGGLGWYEARGAVEARLGYTTQSRDLDRVEGPVSGGDGLGITVQGLRWAGTPRVQALGTYGFSSGYGWSQVQVSVPVGRQGSSTWLAGGEVIAQGFLDVGSYRAVQIGPVVTWETGRGANVHAAVGLKDSNTDDPTWAVRVGVVLFGSGP